jgi:hypothetical protein
MAIPSNCTTIDADMYGIIPNATIDAFENAPPENISRMLIIPLEVNVFKACNWLGSIPGSVTNEQSL